jgi:uncharacterized membrane protein YidH (DUF202 family)
MAKARNDPKGSMEEDLVVAVIGFVIIVMGGLVAAAGFHPRVQNIHDNSPAPLVGNIVAGIGLLVVAVGVILLMVNVVIWISGRLRSRSR